MVINQSFIFIIVISFVFLEWPKGVDSQNTLETTFSFRKKGDKCWNGLGKCDDMCGPKMSLKVDFTCEDINTCCIPKKIVIPINSNKNPSEEEGGGQQTCALNNGKCRPKCLPPTTVYPGSVNECPLRYFCCIKNLKSGPVGFTSNSQSKPEESAPNSSPTESANSEPNSKSESESTPGKKHNKKGSKRG